MNNLTSNKHKQSNKQKNINNQGGSRGVGKSFRARSISGALRLRMAISNISQVCKYMHVQISKHRNTNVIFVF